MTGRGGRRGLLLACPVLLVAGCASADPAEPRPAGRVPAEVAPSSFRPQPIRPPVAVHLARHPGTLQVSWSGDDARRHSVLYSRDAGATWQVVAYELSGSSTEIPTDRLPGGRLTICVVAGHDDPSTGGRAVVRLANRQPFLSVLSPGPRQRYSGWQQIVFTASAADLEDGSLDGSAIVWTSDRDGVLGTGETLLTSADRLSRGWHVISVSVTDSDGGVATVRRRVRVTRVAPPPVPPAPS